MIDPIIQDEQVLINSIMCKLPPVPFVTDQIDCAIKIAKKYLSGVVRNYDKSDNIYLHSLRVANTITGYAVATSQNGFFKYELVIIALLHDILEDVPNSNELQKDLQKFTTVQNTIIDGIKALTNDEEKIELFGRSKYMRMKFVEIFNKDKELFAVKLADRIDNLSCLSTIPDTHDYKKDVVKGKLFINNYLLETVIIDNNLRLAKIYVPDNYRHLYDKLLILLNSEFKF